LGIFKKIFREKRPITKPATVTSSTPVSTRTQTPLVSLESVKSVLESNSIFHEKYAAWSDEKVVDKLIQLLIEEPKKKRDPPKGTNVMPEWLAKHVTEEMKKENRLQTIRDWLFPTIKALGECKSPKAVKPLRQILTSSDEYVDKYIVAAVTEALGKIGGPSAIDKLKLLLRHDEKSVRVRAAIGLARLNQPEGMETLRRVMDEREEWREEGFVVRHFFEIECAKTLYELGDKSGVKLLIEYLGHPAFMAEALTVSALDELEAPECRQAVKEYVSKRARSSRNMLTSAHILAKLDDLSEVHRVTEILVEGDSSERQYAAEICLQLGFTLFLEPLRKRREIEGDEKVQKTIEQAIHRIDTDPVGVKGPPLEVIEPVELIDRLGQKLLKNPNDKAALERKAEAEVYYYTIQLKKGEDKLEALRRLGFAYLFAAHAFGALRTSKAEECFEQVLAEKPDDPVALFGLARTQIMWSGGCNDERKSMLLRAKKGWKQPFTNLYNWPYNTLEFWLSKCP
jgi:HEAT repeat protein